MEERRPIKRRNSIKISHEFVQGVGFHFGPIVRAAVKCKAEVVDRSLAVRLAMDDCRDFEPQQVAFVVVVSAALPIEPASAKSKAEAAFCIGRIAQWPPRTPRPSRPKLRRNAGQVFAILFLRKQSAPGSQQRTEKIRKSLVAPQQVG